MPPSRNRPRVALSVRVRRDLADQLKTLIRDYSGKPHYLAIGAFVEEALTAHIDATLRRIEAAERTSAAPDTNHVTNPEHR